MTATNIAPMHSKSTQSAELRHVEDLLYLRSFLAEYGASKDELRQYDATIARARRRLNPPTTARAAA